MKLSIGEPRRIGAFTVAPLAQVRERSGRIGRGAWLHVEIAAVGVAVRREGRVIIFTMDGQEQDESVFGEIRPQLARLLGGDP